MVEGRGEILKSSILDHAIVEGKSETINKQYILDHGIVEGKGGGSS